MIFYGNLKLDFGVPGYLYVKTRSDYSRAVCNCQKTELIYLFGCERVQFQKVLFIKVLGFFYEKYVDISKAPEGFSGQK